MKFNICDSFSFVIHLKMILIFVQPLQNPKHRVHYLGFIVTGIFECLECVCAASPWPNFNGYCETSNLLRNNNVNIIIFGKYVPAHILWKSILHNRIYYFCFVCWLWQSKQRMQLFHIYQYDNRQFLPPIRSTHTQPQPS